MIRIDEVACGYEVTGREYRQVFRNRAKAVLAAHALALSEAVSKQDQVPIVFPEGWCEPVHVYDGKDAQKNDAQVAC